MDDQPHVPREGSHGVQWGLAIALVLVMVATGVVAWMLGSSNQLGGTSWVLTELPQSGVEIGGHTVTAAFTADEMTGQAPVNSYGGEYTAGGAVFKVGDVARTLMAGPDDAMAVEDAYFEALTTVTAYVYDGDTLTLLDPDGVVFLVFQRAE
ncbi:MAG: META domain-containing protein [Coriobacteriia bacterium]|nr:META domain-containing protein [Coriobacteriia bacterium]MBN2847266.1 META domain-containing protein [Coriobacteriia bacterium]